MKAVGLNFADIFAVLGLYSATPKGSFTPGLEYSGVVAEVGPPPLSANVKSTDGWANVKKGDRVMGVTRFGGVCDCACVHVCVCVCVCVCVRMCVMANVERKVGSWA